LAGTAETTGAAARTGEGEPDSPADLGKRSWWATLKRTFKEYQHDNVGDWAAALTYYAVLSLFPGLIVLVSLLGVFGNGEETTKALLDIVEQVGPASAVETFRGPIEDITESSSGAGFALIVGLAGAVWSASGYLGAFSRASNAVYEVEEGRPFWKMRPQQVAMTILIVLLLTVVSIGLVVSGPVAEAVGDVIGLGETAVTVWQIAKWPLMILIVAFIFAVLYWWAPNVKQPHFRWITPGSLFAVVVWILASGLFALYVANFGSYSATYGSLAGVIVFLLWLWITNNAILLGQEMNAELERQREIEKGVPGAEEEIQQPPKDAPD
jgi:membrane protein